MAKERKAPRKGQAHAEYLALKSEVEELIKAGHNLKAIYEMLLAEGRISMSYQTLHAHRWLSEQAGRRV